MVGEKRQIVIPKQARDLFNIQPGDTLLIIGDEKKRIAIPLKSFLSAAFSKWHINLLNLLFHLL